MANFVWAIGAGKGGVGKTFVSTNLAISLTKLNFKVLIIDGDLSCANLHTALGLQAQQENLSAFFRSKKNLREIVTITEIPNLQFVQGVWDQWSTFEMKKGDGIRLIEEARKLNYDYVLIDLGPGANNFNLEIFFAVDEKILVSTPEPTSVEKTYRFVEAFIFETLKSKNIAPVQANSTENLEDVLNEFRYCSEKSFISLNHFLREKNLISPYFFDELNQNNFKIIMNEVRSQQDLNLGYSIKSVCYKFFGLELEFLGSVDFDNAVWQSVRNREPFLIEKPHTILSNQFISLTKILTTPELHAQILRAVV